MRRSFMALTLCAVAAFAATSAHAALNAYLTIKGSKTRSFNPAVPSGKMIVQVDEAFLHEIKAPRDVATGQASGKRMHKPMTIIKEWGAATPQLKAAMSTGEPISEVTLEFFRQAGKGQVEVYYKVTFKDCLISSIAAPPASDGAKPTESVSFNYQKIEWKAVEGKTVAVDDWMKPDRKASDGS